MLFLCLNITIFDILSLLLNLDLICLLYTDD